MKLLMENWRKHVSDEALIESYMGDWAKHSTLNLGQVARHLRYFFDLPDTPRLQAAKERAKFILNDLIYAVLPPQTHHTPEEVEELTGYSYPELLKMGYDPDYKPALTEAAMTPEEQQIEFDALVDSGSEPSELKATGKYPDVDSLSSEVARRYFERKYDWLEEPKIKK